MLRLETPRLILRDYTPEDFEEYFRLKSDPKVMYYLQDISLHSRKEALEDFRRVLEKFWNQGYMTEAFSKDRTVRLYRK